MLPVLALLFSEELLRLELVEVEQVAHHVLPWSLHQYLEQLEQL